MSSSDLLKRIRDLELKTLETKQANSDSSEASYASKVGISYTNLPSIASASSVNGTGVSVPGELLKRSRTVRSQFKAPTLSTHQSDSALRPMRSTSCESPLRVPSLKDSKGAGRSATNLRRSTHPNQQTRSASVSKKNLEIEINGRPYLVLGTLGTGGSSKVYQVIDQANNRLCALKCVDLNRAEGGQKEAHLNEIQLLKRLSNSGSVITLLDYELVRNYLYILLEKGDIDLASFLKTRRDEIDGLFIRYYWNEMLKCVSVIHKEGVVHSDLKPANFLFVKGALKLIDFGIASALPFNKTSIVKDTQMGTLSYMAPEVIRGYNDRGRDSGEHSKQHFKINRKADVWSLGCILYNMVYGRTPFQHYRSIFEKASGIMNELVTFPNIGDKDLLDVMKRCLEKDPEQRASVEELQNHRYLKGKGHMVPDQSILVDCETDFLRMAEDLRQCSPGTAAKRLKDIMTKRGDGNHS